MQKNSFSATILAAVLFFSISSSPALANSKSERDPAVAAKYHLELGVGYFSAKRYDVALEEARNAVRLDPRSTHALNLLGSIYLEIGDVQKADAALRQSLNLDSQNADALTNMGLLQCRQGRFSEAMDFFAKSLGSPQQNKMSMTLVNAGVCLDKKGDAKAAEQYFRKALEIEPNDVWPQWQLARLYFKQNRLSESEARIGMIHRAVPPNSSTLWLGTLISRLKNDRAEYERQASRLVEQFPNSDETRKLYARDFTLDDK